MLILLRQQINFIILNPKNHTKNCVKKNKHKNFLTQINTILHTRHILFFNPTLMHFLILRTHALRAPFLYRALRYENLGADLCHPENIKNIWYGQYDAVLIPLAEWDTPLLDSLLKTISSFGEVPIWVFTRALPPFSLRVQYKNLFKGGIYFRPFKLPFRHLLKEFNRIEIKKNRPIRHALSPMNQKQIMVNDLFIDTETREVERNGKSIYLRNKEFALLLCLAKNPGKALTRTFLLETVWDRNTSILSNTVDVHINRLRNKIDGESNAPIIKTIPCIGYKLAFQKIIA